MVILAASTARAAQIIAASRYGATLPLPYHYRLPYHHRYEFVAGADALQ